MLTVIIISANDANGNEIAITLKAKIPDVEKTIESDDTEMKGKEIVSMLQNEIVDLLSSHFHRKDVKVKKKL